ncbi:type II/IV secretion system protein [Patescibacteria group bacterium]|nr:type II/IV secretion system protein [Patescibacteria group bacterium]
MNLLTTLAEKNIISQSEIPTIEKEAESSGSSIENVLNHRGIALSDILAIKGEYLNVPTRSLGNTKVPFKVLEYVPQESAQYYKFVPLGIVDEVLEIGIIDTDSIEALDALNFISSKINLPYKIYLITETDFGKVMEMYKGLTGEVSEALEEFETGITIEAEKEKEKGIKKKTSEQVEDVIKEDAPVTKIVATILRYATEGNASDIHIEPMIDKVRVRFRVDGILHTSLVLPHKVQLAVTARIKILSSMRLDEKRKPQDGRFSATIDGRRIDFRVSTFPTHYGEKVVMRILDSEKGVFKLDDMGFSKHNLKLIRQALEKPYGLILVSGPTGSGKTTTLYSMLNELDNVAKNVLSLEDPIEYNIEGVSQSQMFPEIGYTFASGLRSTLRQDPDVIMVGEIRDKETAQLAIQAALTGHLVFSTIHTNNALGVIPRLVDMGVDPYLIAPTLALALAQRLVRTLCPDSGEKVNVDDSLKMMIDEQFADLPESYREEIPDLKHIYRLKPTSACPNGTRGRIAVLEILEINKEIEHIILTNPVEEALYKAARCKGMLTMKEDAIIKSMEGVVPFEEVNTLGGALLVDEESDQEQDRQSMKQVI